MELYSMTAKELMKLLREKKVSSVEIVKSVLSRIDKVEDRVGSYITLTPELALETAQKVDGMISRAEEISDLSGIPISIKDIICVKGILNTCASKMLHNFIPYYNATVADKVIKNDMPILGKLNMDEFAMGSTCENSSYKKTKNPFDLERVPGGSSGGSAACVCADETILSLGTDTGGSVRNPASYCGIVGLKPTYGTVSRYGVVAFASSLDQVGPLAKTVDDTAMLYNVICGYDDFDSTTYKREYKDVTSGIDGGVKGLKIGIPKEFFGSGIDCEVQKSIMDAAKFYEQSGAILSEVSLPSIKYSLPVYYILSSAEVSSNLARFDGIRYGYSPENYSDLHDYYVKARTEGFGEEAKRRIMLGTYVLSAGYYDAYYKKAQIIQKFIKADFDRAFSEVDVLLTPVTPTTAMKIGEFSDDPVKSYMSDICTVSVNIASLPALSLPCGYDKKGLPIGMQLIGNRFTENILFRTGKAFESAHDLRKSAALAI